MIKCQEGKYGARASVSLVGDKLAFARGISAGILPESIPDGKTGFRESCRDVVGNTAIMI